MARLRADRLDLQARADSPGEICTGPVWQTDADALVGKSSICESVSYPFHRPNAVQAELLSQVLDVCVDQAVEHERITAPYGIKDLLACQYSSGIFDEQLQKIKLPGCDGKFTGVVGRRICGKVDAQRAVRPPLRMDILASAAQQCRNPPTEDNERKGLGDVIISHAVEARDLRFLVIQRREHQNRDRGFSPIFYG